MVESIIAGYARQATLRLKKILFRLGVILLILSFQPCPASVFRTHFSQQLTYVPAPFNPDSLRYSIGKAHADFSASLSQHIQKQEEIQKAGKKMRRHAGVVIGTACLASALYASNSLVDASEKTRFGVVESMSLAPILFPPIVTLIGGLILWHKVSNFVHLQCKIDRERDATAFAQHMGEHKADILGKFDAYQHSINAAFSEQQKRAQHEIETLQRDNTQQLTAYKNVMDGYIHTIKEEVDNIQHELKNTATINKELKDKMEKVFPILERIQTKLAEIVPPRRPTSPQPQTTPSRAGGWLSSWMSSPRVSSPSVSSPRTIDLR